MSTSPAAANERARGVAHVSVPTPHHPINYFMIFYLLVALTVVTVAVATFRFQRELVNVLVALIVASIKATFVARYFMHLKFEGKLIYLILLAPVGLCILLMCALIPDIGLGRHTAFNDYIGFFQQLVGGNGSAGS